MLILTEEKSDGNMYFLIVKSGERWYPLCN